MTTAATQLLGLQWTVRRSFINYLAKLPDGRMSVTGGADVDGTEFCFELDKAECAERTGMAIFRGDIRFAGHGSLLSVRITDPAIAYNDNHASLTIALPETDEGPGERIEMATGTCALSSVTTATHRYTVRDLRLTAKGSDMFAGVYPPGGQLDDLHFDIAR